MNIIELKNREKELLLLILNSDHEEFTRKCSEVSEEDYLVEFRKYLESDERWNTDYGRELIKVRLLISRA